MASALIAALCGLPSCDSLLKVNNPGALDEEELANPALETFIVNGAIGEFQYAFGIYALWSSAMADETLADHTNSDYRAISHHDFTDANTVNDQVFANIQRARQSADDATARIKQMQGRKADGSINVARVLIYGGYAYVLLGEGFCEAPVNLSAPLPSKELLARAITRFDEGIAVASKAATTGDSLLARDLINMARIGAARAALKKGDSTAARSYAALVPAAFERMAYYSANSAREYNPLQAATFVIQPFVGIHPVFQGLDDVRLPQPKSARPSQNFNLFFPPFKPSMYSGWTATGAPIAVDVGTGIRFASGLEAQYIRVEVDGPNAAMLSFVNERRAVGGKAPTTVNGTALLAEFRLQRGIDFYLTGQRLGDLRRYSESGDDAFPTGLYPLGAGTYGTRRCFIIPSSEKQSNPNS